MACIVIKRSKADRSTIVGVNSCVEAFVMFIGLLTRVCRQIDWYLITLTLPTNGNGWYSLVFFLLSPKTNIIIKFHRHIIICWNGWHYHSRWLYSVYTITLEAVKFHVSWDWILLVTQNIFISLCVNANRFFLQTQILSIAFAQSQNSSSSVQSWDLFTIQGMLRSNTSCHPNISPSLC